MGKKFISNQQLDELTRVLDEHLKEHFKRSQQRTEKRKDEDYDEGVEEILEDEVRVCCHIQVSHPFHSLILISFQGDNDVYTLSKVSDILHTLFFVFKEDFMPFFDKIVHHFKHLGVCFFRLFFLVSHETDYYTDPDNWFQAGDRSWSEHQWAICVFDDVIENGGSGCLRYKDFFLPLITEGLQSQHPEVRQAAAYGFGVMGQSGGEAFSRICADVLPLLKAMIEAPDSRSADNVYATENAISAVAKILHYNSSQINVNEVLPVWLKWLPVYEDEEELPHVYGFLLLLLEK